MKTRRLAVAAAVLAIISACSNPEGDWQKAESENTEAAYQAFFDKYPEGEWAQKAQAQLDAIKDTRDWENAQTSDAIEAYNNYLLAHPTGAYMGEARQRITELETEAAWNAAQSAGTKEALDDFLVRYADSPQAEQARAQLAALNPPPPPPEPRPAAAATKPAAKAPAAKARGVATPPKSAFQVQMGAFSSRDKAQAEKTRMQQRFGGITGALSVHTPSGTDTLYRVRSVAMSESAARSACQQLKRSGQDCVVIRP
jgi:cell division protein FtsN